MGECACQEQCHYNTGHPMKTSNTLTRQVRWMNAHTYRHVYVYTIASIHSRMSLVASRAVAHIPVILRRITPSRTAITCRVSLAVGSADCPRQSSSSVGMLSDADEPVVGIGPAVPTPHNQPKQTTHTHIHTHTHTPKHIHP